MGRAPAIRRTYVSRSADASQLGVCDLPASDGIWFVLFGSTHRGVPSVSKKNNRQGFYRPPPPGGKWAAMAWRQGQ